MSSDPSSVIHVSAVVLRDSSGALLTVRKAGTSRFMLPGGKPEVGESAAITALRECSEELGVELDPAGLRRLGVFRCRAANEPGHEVQATVFEHPELVAAHPAAEIAELRWLDPSTDPLPGDLAPLLAEQVIPALEDRGRRSIGRIALFTGSRTGHGDTYLEATATLGSRLAETGVGIIYGGGQVGLMGVLADAALERGGTVTGITTEALFEGETAHTSLTRLEVVATMHERKQRMADLCDAFVALPGGAGTLEEFFEAWTWQHLGIHAKPVALYNVAGFWDPLLAMIKAMAERGFLAPLYRDTLIVSDDPDDLLDQLGAWRSPTPKWSQ
ncbi:TIGR00730 family Rossman fold protein [Arthrobacter rhombi]|uniref:TIGR00730 family Rossman fold protein n=1 Tax=Arthrobacter rhombi TaxID=71253 RepID=UPI003F8FAB59